PTTRSTLSLHDALPILHRSCPFGITLETHFRKFGFNHARMDGSYLNVFVKQVNPHALRQRVHGVLCSAVYISVGVYFLAGDGTEDRKSTRLNSSHVKIS